MRRSWASLLLAFCLAFSQQGALLHELGHLVARVGALPHSVAHAHEAGVGCDGCLAFEHIAGAVATPCVIQALLSPGEYWPTRERFSIRAAVAPEASARDPPVS